MIKLTEVTVDVEGEVTRENPVYIPAGVVIRPWREYTSVTIPNAGCAVVKESPEEVARKVLDYKLHIARYNAALEEVDDKEAMGEFAYAGLAKLAGLEESQ